MFRVERNRVPEGNTLHVMSESADCCTKSPIDGTKFIESFNQIPLTPQKTVLYYARACSDNITLLQYYKVPQFVIVKIQQNT